MNASGDLLRHSQHFILKIQRRNAGLMDSCKEANFDQYFFRQASEFLTAAGNSDLKLKVVSISS